MLVYHVYEICALLSFSPTLPPSLSLSLSLSLYQSHSLSLLSTHRSSQ